MVYMDRFVVCIKCNGKILRENSDNSVLLPFKSEYSIFLRNMDPERKVLVNVDIDGQDVLDDYSLIVDKDDNINLERFIKNGNFNSGNRFKFIKKTEEISNFRGNRAEDGLIRVQYKFEVPIKKDDNLKISKNIYHNNYYHYPVPTYKKSSLCDDPISYNEQTCFSCSNISNMNRSASQDGITTSGSISNQNFNINNDDILWDSYFNVIIIKLLGYDKKGNLISKEINSKTKKQCPACGRKYSYTFKYCPNCGTYL